ncbi:MAG: hypothetical protein IKZ88_03895 [Neisseriaceae bacterium]|nr:hypothetical protein [Neisseriaceae bacterium]
MSSGELFRFACRQNNLYLDNASINLSGSLKYYSKRYLINICQSVGLT